MRAAILAVLVLSGCAAEPAVPDAPATPPAQVRPGVSLDRILGPHDDEGAFLDGLRAPRRRATEPVANRHDPAQTDTVRTLVYDGLEIEAYAVTGGPTFIQRVAVTDARYGTSDGLAVGETQADLEAVLGPPTVVEDGVAVYETGGGPTPTTVEVVYVPDDGGTPRASVIAWAPYLD